MTTPSASDTRRNTASEASSCSLVVRLTKPAASAMIRPATRPPSVMAKTSRPAARNPIATPGRMACAMASPTRLIRRSIRNTPIGPALNASARIAASVCRTEGSASGSSKKLDSMGLKPLRARRMSAAWSSKASHIRRDLFMFSAVSTSCGRAPGDRLAREQERLREACPDEAYVVERRQHGAALAVPAAAPDRAGPWRRVRRWR